METALSSFKLRFFAHQSVYLSRVSATIGAAFLGVALYLTSAAPLPISFPYLIASSLFLGLLVCSVPGVFLLLFCLGLFLLPLWPASAALYTLSLVLGYRLRFGPVLFQPVDDLPEIRRTLGLLVLLQVYLLSRPITAGDLTLMLDVFRYTRLENFLTFVDESRYWPDGHLFGWPLAGRWATEYLLLLWSYPVLRHFQRHHPDGLPFALFLSCSCSLLWSVARVISRASATPTTEIELREIFSRFPGSFSNSEACAVMMLFLLILLFSLRWQKLPHVKRILSFFVFLAAIASGEKIFWIGLSVYAGLLTVASLRIGGSTRVAFYCLFAALLLILTSGTEIWPATLLLLNGLLKEAPFIGLPLSMDGATSIVEHSTLLTLVPEGGGIGVALLAAALFYLCMGLRRALHPHFEKLSLAFFATAFLLCVGSYLDYLEVRLLLLLLLSGMLPCSPATPLSRGVPPCMAGLALMGIVLVALHSNAEVHARGVHSREHSEPYGDFAWTGSSAEIPFCVTEGDPLEMIRFTTLDPTGPEFPVAVQLAIGPPGRVAAETTIILKRAEITEWRVPVPLHGIAILSIRVIRPWCPKELHINEDRRVLGAIVLLPKNVCGIERPCGSCPKGQR